MGTRGETFVGRRYGASVYIGLAPTRSMPACWFDLRLRIRFTSNYSKRFGDTNCPVHIDAVVAMVPNLSLEVWDLICAQLSHFDRFLDESYTDGGLEEDESNHDTDDQGHQVTPACEQYLPKSEIQLPSHRSSASNEHIPIPSTHLHSGSGRQALISLCLVSRSHYQLASRHLYTYFDGNHDRAIFFLRTLIQKPHHVQEVQGLHIEPYGETMCFEKMDRDPRANWTAFALCSLLNRAVTVSRSFPQSLTGAPNLTDEGIQQALIAQWLLLQLAKLRHLKISVAEDWDFPFLRQIVFHDRTILPELSTLHILGPPRWQVFSGTPVLMQLRPVECLFILPSLVELTLDYCFAFHTDIPSLRNLRRINHRACAAVTCQIGDLVSMCAELECYTLEFGSGQPLHLDYLHNCRKRLQRLEVEALTFRSPRRVSGIKRGDIQSRDDDNAGF